MAGKRGASKRPLYVNGSLCESMAAAGREATRILGRIVYLWEIQRVANGQTTIPGIDVVEAKNVSIQNDAESVNADRGGLVSFCKPQGRERLRGEPLILYPPEESPLERGLSRYH